MAPFGAVEATGCFGTADKTRNSSQNTTSYHLINCECILPLEGPAATVAAPAPLTGLSVWGKNDHAHA